MLQLYDLNHVKLHGLVNYKDLKRERTLEGEEILSFLYPQIDNKYSSINEECYIRTKQNEYVIKELSIQDEWTEFVAKVNVETIKGTTFESFETVEQLCTDAVNLALAGTGWTIGSCDVSKRRTVRKSKCSSYDILSEIRKIYNCDFRFDAINKKVYVYQSMGSAKGSYFTEELNLKKLSVQSSSYDYCTRIIPIGKDGLQINSINDNKEYVENYQYSNKVITIYWEDNRYTVAESLKEDAAVKLNDLSKPIKAYSAEIIDLARLNDKYSNILDYDLGDTITLLSKDKKVKEKQRIVKLIEYPDEPERNSCEIANRTLRFEDMQAESLDAVDIVNSVTTSDRMIDTSKVDFNPLRLEVVTLITQKADIGELNSAVARIGTLETTKANITDLTAATARITTLESTSATITNLNAAVGKITTLESKTASIDTLLAGNLTAQNMQAKFITAESGLIANEAIKDAMILNMSADKINAGKINTNLVSIQSESGNMLMSDNTIQIKDATRVRVQIGKDASNDYNMYVWDASGSLMFDATGLKASGIKDKIIRNDMVSDTANIQGSKLDINSVVSSINGATTLLKATKVKLDTENQTLDVAFTSLKSTVTTQGNTITSQGTSISTIQGQITSKVWQQDITTAVDNVQIGVRNLLRYSVYPVMDASKWNKVSFGSNTFDLYTDADLKTWYRFIHTVSGGNSAYVELVNYPIKVESTRTFTISFKYKTNNQCTNIPILILCESNNSGNLYNSFISRQLTNNLNETYYTYTFTLGASVTRIALRFDNNQAVTSDAVLYLRDIKIEEGTKATSPTIAQEDLQGQIDTANTNISTISTNYSSLTQTVSGITANVSSLQTTTSSLGTRMAIAEGSITTLNNSIVSKVTQTDINNSINALNIGVRNLIRNSANFKDTSNWVSVNSSVIEATVSNGELVITKKGTAGSIHVYNTLTKDIVGGNKYTLSACVKASIDNRVFGMGFRNPTTGTFLTTQFNKTLGVKDVYQIIKITIIADSSGSYGIALSSTPMAQNETLTFKWIKLEEGDKATDYTSAPEDTQTQIDGVTTRITSAEQKITAEAITSTVSKSVMTASQDITTIDSHDANIYLLGTHWVKDTNVNYINGKGLYTTTIGEYLEYTFIGTGIEINDLTNFNRGKVDISIDGGTATIVDCYSAAAVHRVAYSVTNLTYGTHKIKILVRADRNASATSNYFVLEFIRIFNNTAVNTTTLSTQIQQNADSVKIAVGQIGGNNLIKNGRFEFGLTSWTYSSGYPNIGYISVANGYGVLVNTGNNENFLQQIDIPVKPNTKYTLSCILSCDTNVVSSDVYVIGSNVKGGGYTIVHPLITSIKPTTPTKYTVTFTTGANENYLLLRFDNNGTNNSTSWNGIAVKDVKLEEGENATAWSPNPNELKNSSFEVTDNHARFTGTDGSYVEFVPGSTGLKWHKVEGDEGKDFHYLSAVGRFSVDMTSTGQNFTITLPPEFKGKKFSFSPFLVGFSMSGNYYTPVLSVSYATPDYINGTITVLLQGWYKDMAGNTVTSGFNIEFGFIAIA